MNEIRVWNMGEMIMTGKDRISRKKNPKSVPIWEETCKNALGSRPGIRGKMPLTN